MIRSRTRRALARLLPLLALAGAPAPARAWDPTTTHVGITEAAALRSALHLRWMAASELTRGLFTPLRIDPTRLQPAERRLLVIALERASDATGARALGGPGACPGASAPAETQRYCVVGDTWQLPALGWLELGVLAELTPSARTVHHFVDRADPSAPTWSDPELPAWLLRVRQSRHNGASLASQVNRTGFAGHGPSAITWLADPQDLLAPPRLHAHLERAYLAEEPEERQHHLALALVCAGALLHVSQDLTVPAHARGDASAFFAPLSGEAGDRGLPLQEYARRLYGRRDLPLTRDAGAIAAARGRPLADDLLGHLLGQGSYEGAARFTGRRFLSESSVPAPRFLDDELSADEAAAQLVQGAFLDPVETEGARLAPWPAERGYLLSAAGRPLAAFDRDDDGRVRAFLDEVVYRDQAQALLPAAVDLSRSLLDLLFPGWPAMTLDRAGRALELDVSPALAEPFLLLIHQDGDGRRAIRRKVALTPGKRNRVTDVPLAEGNARLVLVLRASIGAGDPHLWEYVVAADAAAIPLVPAPYVPPEVSEAIPDEDEGDAPALPPEPLPEESEDEEPEPEPEPAPEPAKEPAKAKKPAKAKQPAKTEPAPAK